MNDDMVARLKRAMWTTWETIAADIMAIDNSASVTREVVVEVVTDADRLRFYGNDTEVVEAYYALPYGSDERNRLDLLCFPDEEYC